MKICTNCRMSFNDSDNICPQCGASLTYIPEKVAEKDPYDHTGDFSQDDIESGKLFALCAYIFGIFGILLAYIATQSEFARFHAKQSIKFLLFEYILSLAAVILAFTFIVPIAAILFAAFLEILKIICWVQVLSGQAKDAPIVRMLKI